MIRHIVVRACIAMQYPPRRRATPAGREVWLRSDGQALEERLPEENRHLGYDLVHFDLDPKNGKQLVPFV